MLGASQIIGTNSFGGPIAASGAAALSGASADRFERGTIRRIEAKEHVFCDGDPRTHVFRIEEGVIALSKLLGDGRRQIIEFAYPGDYIGLGTLREHIFDAQATCAAKVRCLSAAALEQEASRDAGLALRLYKAVSAELAAARSLLVSVGQQSAMERLAGFLLGLSARATSEGGENVVKLSMRRSDIADLLGLTIETVSRTITKLRTMRVIEVVRGTEVHILDSDRLAELAGQ
ncbi:Crp/Fnr family transcriptional regulator [Hyphomicrobium sp.]|jgi:CRP/FNR family transcriptional regulator|uniref:Crp/Fnr family transcriptional regulator n=1 Tax=Hyphomicrobium sp. TaxID=82 RepID=UPI003562E84C